MRKLALMIFMAWLLWVSPIEGARTYIVDDDGFANYKTIGGAVVAAGGGDTIYIKPGIYSEEVTLNRSLTLMPLPGESGPIVLKADGKKTGITIVSDGCSVQGLTVQGFSGPGVSIQSTGNTVKDCQFEKDNPAILIWRSNKNIITHNTMNECQAGVALWDNSSENTVQENKLAGCNISILLRDVAKDRVAGNNVTGSSWGLWLENSSNIEIAANNILSKAYGIWVFNSSASKLTDNRVQIESDGSTSSRAVFLANASQIELEGNKVSGGGIGVGILRCHAGRIAGNSLTGSTRGIFIMKTDSHEVNNNSIEGTEQGIRLENSSDCSLQGDIIKGSTAGITIVGSVSNTIRGNTISDTKDTAVEMAFSSGNHLFSNQIQRSERGIIMTNSFANRLENNSLQQIKWGLYVDGSVREDFNNSIDESNLVDGKPIAYIFGRSGGLIQNKDLSHLTLAYCDKMAVKNVAITSDAIFLFSSNNNSIQKNNVSRCFGMRLVDSPSNLISGNRLDGNSFSGMFLYSSDANQIDNNTASDNNQNGISLLGCSGNILRDNNVQRNSESGIWLNLSHDNWLYQNNITDNLLGMEIMNSQANHIVHNNFINNKEHARDTQGNNTWDLGNVTGGNYWSGHVAKGNPSRNWPRMIKGGKMDNYPFQDVSGWV